MPISPSPSFQQIFQNPRRILRQRSMLHARCAGIPVPSPRPVLSPVVVTSSPAPRMAQSGFGIYPLGLRSVPSLPGPTTSSLSLHSVLANDGRKPTVTPTNRPQALTRVLRTHEKSTPRTKSCSAPYRTAPSSYSTSVPRVRNTDPNLVLRAHGQRSKQSSTIETRILWRWALHPVWCPYTILAHLETNLWSPLGGTRLL